MRGRLRLPQLLPKEGGVYSRTPAVGWTKPDQPRDLSWWVMEPTDQDKKALLVGQALLWAVEQGKIPLEFVQGWVEAFLARGAALPPLRFVLGEGDLERQLHLLRTEEVAHLLDTPTPDPPSSPEDEEWLQDFIRRHAGK